VTKPTTRRRLWRCPECGRGFANRNQSHFCGKHSLDAHFDRKDACVRELFNAFLALLRRFGPVTVLPEKTRIAFQVRMSFAALSVRRTYLVGHFVLARRLEHPRFLGIQTISPRNHVHQFRLQRLADLDEEFSRWAGEAYAVGQQKHLPENRKRRTRGGSNGDVRDQQA
jgi:endogenous inhibitor of DNA gyrase (YacG/DUF329 family)